MNKMDRQKKKQGQIDLGGGLTLSDGMISQDLLRHAGKIIDHISGQRGGFFFRGSASRQIA